MSRSRFPADSAERGLTSQPLPIADAISALVSAESEFEERDRVVEVFRAVLRTLSAFVLAARIQFGRGPGTESTQIADLIRSLRSRGLTDGQWFAIVREMLRPWEKTSGSYPLTELVGLIHGKKAELPKLIDELLAMRKSETVAHGASGTKAALIEILDRRVPQLVKLLNALLPLWERARLVVPLAKPEVEDEVQSAWLLMGDTPARGRWQRIELALGVRAEPGEALLIDAESRPLLALHPLVLVRRPSPEAIEEVFVLDGGSKKGAVFVALPSMAEHREAEAWAVLSRALSDEEAPPENPEASGVERPFRGLQSFGPEHSAVFFGREEQTEALANRIRRCAFVTVTGPSGSGKTSLLRAGALPTLRDHVAVFVRPGAKPLEALCARIAEATRHFLSEAELLETLRSDPSSLGAKLAIWSRESLSAGPASAPPSSAVLGKVFRIASEPSAPKMVIVVDQAEELLTLCSDEAERETFAKAIASAGASQDLPSRVVLSVREDFFGRLATVPSLRGAYSRTVEVVTTPDRDSLARTLYLPAKQFGYTFEDEQLITNMVDAVANEPSALALLQFCADKLWEVRDRTWKRLTWDAYRATGGVEGALASHADQVLAEMSPVQRTACRNLLLRLVTADRTRAVSTRSELLESAALPDHAAAVLDQLISGRLLTVGEASEPDGGARVEIVHEALIEHWGALAAWLNEDVEGQRLSHALQQAAREWETRKRPRGLLWRGDALLDLRRFRKRATYRLTAIEAAFVDASEADERRGSRIRRGLIAGAFIATGAFATFMFFQWRSADEARKEAERQRSEAEVRGLIAEARNLEPAGKLGESLALLRAATSLEQATKPGITSAVSLDMLRLHRAGAAARVLSGHAWGLMRLALSPDGKTLATAARDGTVKLWDPKAATLLRTLSETDDPILSIAYFPNGKTLAASNGNAKGDGGVVHLWDTSNGKLGRSIEMKSTAQWVAVSPDGTLLAIATNKHGAALHNAETGTLVAALGEPTQSTNETQFSFNGKRVLVRAGNVAQVYAAPSGELVATLAAHEKPILGISFSHSGRLVASASVDGTMRVWDADTGNEISKFASEGGSSYSRPMTLHAVAFSPDDKLIAVSAKDGSIRLVLAENGQVMHTLSRHTLTVEQLVFSRDGRQLLAASQDGSASVWEVATGALIEVLRGHKEGLCCALYDDETHVITGSEDRTARVWNIADGPYLRTLGGHSRSVDRLVASADGAVLASGSQDGTVRAWDTQTGMPFATYADHKGTITALAISPDGKLIVTSAVDTPPRVFERTSVIEKITLPDQEKGAVFAEFSPDGTLFATAAQDGKVVVWDSASFARKAVLLGHEKKVARLVFSRDSKKLVSASWDGTARIWDLAKPETPIILKGAEGWVTAALFSPDNKTVLIAANEEARVFDANTGAELRQLKGHEQQINGLTFSPDGSLIATGSLDSTVRTFRADTGAPVRTFVGHTEAVMEVAFSDDGERLYSAGDTTVRVFHVGLGTLLETLTPYRTDVTLRNASAVLPLGHTGLIATSAMDGTIEIFKSAPANTMTAFAEAGALTNYRVCRSSLKVVAIMPSPSPDTVWADDSACKD